MTVARGRTPCPSHSSMLTRTTVVPQHITNEIRERLRSNREPTLVSISGGSSTGKSSQIAAQILGSFQGTAEVVQLDCMMGSVTPTEDLDPTYRWDHPSCYGLDTIATKIKQLLARRTIELPVYDFAKGQNTSKREVSPSRLLLVEGLYADFGPLEGIADISIYVEAPLGERLIRRSFRNMYERYRLPDPSRTIEGFFRSVLPAHRDFVQTQSKRADHIIKVEYAFSETLARFDCQEALQTDSKNWIDWAELEGAVVQIRNNPDYRIRLLSSDDTCYFDCQINKDCYQAIEKTDPFEN